MIIRALKDWDDTIEWIPRGNRKGHPRAEMARELLQAAGFRTDTELKRRLEFLYNRMKTTVDKIGPDDPTTTFNTTGFEGSRDAFERLLWANTHLREHTASRGALRVYTSKAVASAVLERAFIALYRQELLSGAFGILRNKLSKVLDKACKPASQQAIANGAPTDGTFEFPDMLKAPSDANVDHEPFWMKQPAAATAAVPPPAAATPAAPPPKPAAPGGSATSTAEAPSAKSKASRGSSTAVVRSIARALKSLDGADPEAVDRVISLFSGVSCFARILLCSCEH
jgi:hypothetical protein